MTETKIETKNHEGCYPDFKMGDKLIFDKYPLEIYMCCYGAHRGLVNLNSGCFLNDRWESESALQNDLLKRGLSYRIVKQLEIKEI